MQIGDRAGAVLGTDGDTIKFLGFGTYEKDEIPSKDAIGYGKILRSCGIANPKIILDNGKVVWGCECWWGEEKSMKKTLERYKNIENVDIDELRKNN